MNTLTPDIGGAATLSDALPRDVWQRLLSLIPPHDQAAVAATSSDLALLVEGMPSLELNQRRLAGRLAAVARGDIGAGPGPAPWRARVGAWPRRGGERLAAVVDTLAAQPDRAAFLTSLRLPVDDLSGGSGGTARARRRLARAAVQEVRLLCPRLERLHAGCDSGATPLPADILSLGRLVDLDLRGAAVPSLGRHLSGLAGLTRLDLRHAGPGPLRIGSLSALASLLHLRLDDSTQLRGKLSDLGGVSTRLLSLSVLGCPGLDVFGRDLARMRSLTSLTLSELPEDPLGDVQGGGMPLAALRLGALQSGSRADGFFRQSTDLVSLRIDSARGDALPGALGSLGRLTRLELSRAEAEDFYQALDGLTALRHLSLSSCPNLRYGELDAEAFVRLETVELADLPALRRLFQGDSRRDCPIEVRRRAVPQLELVSLLPGGDLEAGLDSSVPHVRALAQEICIDLEDELEAMLRAEDALQLRADPAAEPTAGR